MLTIYAPSNKPNSKCWEVFNGVSKTWPTATEIKDNAGTELFSPAMFWGLVNNNTNLIHAAEQQKLDYWFTDTPYFCRFNNAALRADNHYWRICKNAIHAKFIRQCPSDRFDKFNLEIKQRNNHHGEYILVCPSSLGIHNYLKKIDWTSSTIKEIKKYTDRPIKIREKPRGLGTSGPTVASVTIQKDLENAWACVTSCSISAVEAAIAGVPIFSDPKSFAWTMSAPNLSEIENPFYADPTRWLYSLAYQQFTPKEYADGTAVSILKEMKIL